MGVLFSGIVLYFDVRTQTDRHPLTQEGWISIRPFSPGTINEHDKK